MNFICEFVEEKAEEMDQELIPIAQMHNIVEGALDKVNPLVAKSYRDYRNYKQDFVRMLDDVYKKSQAILSKQQEYVLNLYNQLGPSNRLRAEAYLEGLVDGSYRKKRKKNKN